VRLRNKITIVFAALLCFAFAMPVMAQSNTANCGGTTCVQGRFDLQPLGDSQNDMALLMATAPNGSKIIYGIKSEDLTLSTGGTTTDTTQNLLPPNSLIVGGSAVLTTAISGGTCSGFQLGDPTTAGRFTASNTTLTQGTTDIFKVQATTGVASATTGNWQASAAKVRVTCATGAPGAGKIRISVFYIQFVAPVI
jgi:hypothetical protein